MILVSMEKNLVTLEKICKVDINQQMVGSYWKTWISYAEEGINMRETVYVCIPAYNAEKHIKKCIKSVLKQDYQLYKVVVVDDGSVDNTGAICDDFAKNDNRVVVLHKKNGGLWSARQKAIEYVKRIEEDNDNSYLMFLDADDTLKENALSTVVKYMKNDGTDMLIFGFDWVKEDGRIVKTFSHNKKDMGILADKRELYKIVYYDQSYNSLCRKAMRLKLFRNETEYDYHPMYGEDLLRSIDLYRNCTAVSFIKDILYNYMIVSSSITHSIKIDSQVRDFCYIKSFVYSALKDESSMKQEDMYDFYCKSYIGIEEIVNNIAVSSKTKGEKIHLFQILRNDKFTKVILTEVSHRDFVGRLFNDERYSALITVGKLSYYLSRIKTRLRIL